MHGGRRWRSAAVAICLLPVVLPLALLCLPLLCFAVTVVRFRRRRRLRMAARKGKCARLLLRRRGGADVSGEGGGRREPLGLAAA
ncbi:hypothetical protein OsJ_33167 [Oryza sativa Japonica Group]|uniref:Uncharacterized protein n=1 Tax=Oryza sativa subsp. japonica TaxID=39947 RepID=A3C969_ORYSJ|nr:hypothetical protein OsJ_33167 [Oryza sativa Japonica Group]